MEPSVFIAKILGPVCLAAGVGLMLNREFYLKVMKDFSRDSGLILYGGILALVIGLVIVEIHNVWVPGWPVIITIYGWGGIIKGVWLLVFPKTVPGFMGPYSKNKALMSLHSVICVLIGAVLTAMGYFVG
jgi:hypothetical protein